MIVKVKFNPSVIEKDDTLNKVFSCSNNKRILLKEFTMTGSRHGLYFYLNYIKKGNISVQRLLEKLALTVFYCRRYYYLRRRS